MSYVSHSATAIVATRAPAGAAPKGDDSASPDAHVTIPATESIYAWVKAPPPPVVKAPLYHSQHPGDAPVAHAHSSFVDAAAVKATGLLGKEVRGTVRPDAYLRRRGGVAAGTVEARDDANGERRTAVAAAAGPRAAMWSPAGATSAPQCRRSP